MRKNLFLAALLAGMTVAPAMAVRDFDAAPQVNPNQKGSLLYWSDVEVKFDGAPGAEVVTADTIIELTNDSNNGVYVQMYFINGDCPLAAEVSQFPGQVELIERAHPGWNFVDVQIFLSPNKPTWWSAATGNNTNFLPGPFPGGDSTQVPPFGNLDADPAPIGSPDHFGTGRLDPDNRLFNLNRRTVRGFIIGWAVEIGGSEITHNELTGSATKVDYVLGAAWEYDAFSYRRLGSTAGDGALELDGVEYNASPARLQLNFYSVPTVIGGGPLILDTDLTLHLAGADLRAVGTGPATTWVQADIWNQNEDRFSGTARCLTCWDGTLLSDFMGVGVVGANHFLRANIGTDKGKARLTGKAGVWCPNCHQDNHFGGPTDPFILSTDQAILGVSNKIIAAAAIGMAGSNLTLHGTDDSAVVMWDIVDAARSLEEEETRAMDASRALINQSKLESATLGGRN
jgi:hypothetical protein